MSDQSINALNIPSIQNKKQIYFQQTQTPTMQGGTSMQGVDSEKIKQSVDNSYLANRAKASKETNPLTMLGVGTGVWYGISQGMDKFNPKCEGAYEKSILGKLGAWGDKISTKTWLGKKINNFIRWVDVKTYNLSKKSKIMYTLRNHSTRPEWGPAKTPWGGLHGFQAMDTEQVFREFLKPISGREPYKLLGFIPIGKPSNFYQGLEQYGAKQADIDNFVNSLKGKSFADKALALQKEELRLLGADTAMVSKIEGKTGLTGLQKLAKSLKVKKLGFNSLREYKEINEKFLDNPDKVMKALSKADPNIKVSIWRSHTKLGKIINHFFGRRVSLSEYYNKYIATLGKGNKTALGRFLPKALGWFLEGTTNRFAGGKLAVAMQAGIFADMLINAYKAPKGEKGKTLAERFVNDFTYFIALTAGIIGTHKIGGFKYAGLDNKGREAYRKVLAEFNDKVKAGLLSDKKSYKAASKAVDAALGSKNIKNPITKLLHKIGKLVNIGNERKLSYRSTSKVNMNFLRKFANGNILGVPLRIAIPMAIVSPFLAKWATKGAHAIFGRPTHSVLDEDAEEEQAKDAAQQTNPVQTPTPQQNQPQPLQQPAQINKPQQTAQQHKSPNDYKSDTNLIKMAANGKKPQQTAQAGNTTDSTKDTDKNKEMEPVRTYIPSPIGMVPQAQDTTGLDAAFAQADQAEKYVNDILSMKGS